MKTYFELHVKRKSAQIRAKIGKIDRIWFVYLFACNHYYHILSRQNSLKDLSLAQTKEQRVRRPRFHRWIRLEVLRTAKADKFNLRKLAWQLQQQPQGPMRDELAAALLLYAHENEQVERLMSFVVDESLANEYLEIERHLGKRSIERLALRGTPLMQLPETYRQILANYMQAYQAPEQVAAEKESLRELAYEQMLLKGLSPTEVAHALSMDPGNMHAYLVRGETGRFTLTVAHSISDYLSSKPT